MNLADLIREVTDVSAHGSIATEESGGAKQFKHESVRLARQCAVPLCIAGVTYMQIERKNPNHKNLLFVVCAASECTRTSVF